MTELSPADLTLAAMCVQFADGEAARRLDTMEARGIPVFPTYDVGG